MEVNTIFLVPLSLVKFTDSLVVMASVKLPLVSPTGNVIARRIFVVKSTVYTPYKRRLVGG